MKVFIELDGTLYNINHRADLRHDFSAYWSSAIDDKIKKPMLELIQLLSDEYEIIGFSCRPESYRQETEEKLRFDEVPVDDLLLRADDDRQKEADLREEFILGDGYDKDGNYVVHIMVLNRFRNHPYMRTILNHELKHAYQDWQRQRKGYPVSSIE